MARRLLMALTLLTACGPAARSLRPTLPVAGGTRTILTLTDLEEVRDVASDGSAVFAATDDGLLVYRGEGAPTRIGRAEGLPSDDVTAVAVDGTGLLVATGEGVARVEGTTVTPIPLPAVARIMDVAVMPDGTAWVCSLSGLLRRSADAWAVFGDPFHCTTLAPTPEGQLWAGSDAGVFYVDRDGEGDIVREHGASSGIPERYVRSIVPVLPGQILALLSGVSRASLGLFDGEHWYSYTLPRDAGVSDDERVVGLVGSNNGMFFVTTHHVFLIAPTGTGHGFIATSTSNSNVRSFRPTITDVATAPAPAAVAASEVLRAPQQIDLPGATSVSAPPLVARALPLGLTDLYRGLSGDGRAYAAVANGGIVELRPSGDGPRFVSRSLVHESDLQLATGDSNTVWARAADGDVGRFEGGRLRRLPLPADVSAQSIATGREGAYLLVLVRGTSTMRVYTSTADGFRLVTERTLEGTVTALPFAAVHDERIWVGLEIPRESGEGDRMRGVAVVNPSSDTVVYHHRGANQEAGGLPLPDEATTMTFDDAGNAWFATLSGAVRVEEHQAIVFDETRGVRGDVVTDIAGGASHMWIVAAEGLGTYADRTFDFVHPEVVMTHRPVAVAIDTNGHVWAGGRYGLLHFDGTTWSHVPLEGADVPRGTAAIPLEDIRDVEIDALGRVWLLGPDRILVLSP